MTVMMERGLRANDLALAELKTELEHPEGKFDVVVSNVLPPNKVGYYLARHFRAALVMYATEQVRSDTSLWSSLGDRNRAGSIVTGLFVKLMRDLVFALL